MVDEGFSTTSFGKPSRQRRGALVFAQPFVVAMVVVWLLNDHVFKDRYASWWTGKLSDVAGLVVFPLVIAAIIERWTRRPLRIAIIATAVFYTSINTIPVADGFTEWTLGLFLGNATLTIDPTDLLVLPALAGAALAWRRPVSLEGLRRAWGRVVFAAATATTLATTPDMAESERFSGTAFLTEAESAIEVPFTLTLDGDDAEGLGSLFVDTTVVPYGAPADRSDITVEKSLIEPGIGVLRIELDDVGLAPVEVEWEMHAFTEGSGGLFFGDDAEEPVLVADPPEDTFGPDPVLEVTIDRTVDVPIHTSQIELTVSAGATPRLSLPDSDRTAVRLVTEDGAVAFDGAAVAPVEPPDRCASTNDDPCVFTVTVAATGWGWDERIIVLPADGQVEAVDLGAVAWHTTTFEDRTSDQVFTEAGPREIPLDVDVSPPDDPRAAALTFVAIEALPIAPETGPLSTSGDAWVRSNTQCPGAWIDTGCEAARRQILLRVGFNGDELENAVTVSAGFVVEVWSPVEIPAADVAINVD